MKKLSFEEVKQRFIKKGRTDIIICEEGFNGWKKKSKFINTTNGEIFWSIPR